MKPQTTPIVNNRFGHGLVYQGDIPLRWYLPEAPLDDAAVLQLQGRNEDVLHTLLEFSDINSESREEKHEYHPDLARIEAKVDLLLKLLNQVYMRGIILPDKSPLTLGSDYAKWFDVRAPAVGENIILECFLDFDYPRPLTFSVLVKEVTECDGRFKIEVSIDRPGEIVKQSLEKFIFRYHRRSIAALSRQRA